MRVQGPDVAALVVVNIVVRAAEGPRLHVVAELMSVKMPSIIRAEAVVAAVALDAESVVLEVVVIVVVVPAVAAERISMQQPAPPAMVITSCPSPKVQLPATARPERRAAVRLVLTTLTVSIELTAMLARPVRPGTT